MDFRIENIEYFLVLPVIINNTVCTHLFQQPGVLDCKQYISSSSFDPLGWENPEFAVELHRWFINRHENDRLNDLRFESVELSLGRFSINCMSWFAEAFAKFGGKVVQDDEMFLSVIQPGRLNKLKLVFGVALVSHFAFYTQREFMDQNGILEQYETLVQTNQNCKRSDIYKVVSAFSEIPSSKNSSYPEAIVGPEGGLITSLKVPVLMWVSLGKILKRPFSTKPQKYILN